MQDSGSKASTPGHSVARRTGRDEVCQLRNAPTGNEFRYEKDDKRRANGEACDITGDGDHALEACAFWCESEHYGRGSGVLILLL